MTAVLPFRRDRRYYRPDPEVRRRVDAWKRSRARRLVRWLSRHEFEAAFVASLLGMAWALYLGMFR